MNGCAFLCSAAILFPIFARAQIVSVQNGDVFIAAQNGSPTQVTKSGRDSDPALSPDGQRIVFARATPERKVSTGSGDETSELWLVQADGTKPLRILEPRAAENMEQVLAKISRPQFSADGRRIFFETTAYATSQAVHMLDLTTRKEHFVCAGDDLEVLRSGKYRDHLLVQQHRYFIGGGSYDWYWLLRPNGKEVGPVGEDPANFKEIYSLPEPPISSGR